MSRTSPISCLNCGYSIEGLADDAACPECAFAIRDTISSFRSVGQAFSLPRAAASRFALLGAFQLIAALWLCVFPLHLASGYRLLFTFSEVITLCAMGAALLLWVCIQGTWHFISLTFNPAFAPKTRMFLKVCSGIAVIGTLFGSVVLFSDHLGPPSRNSLILPAIALPCAVLASMIGIVPVEMLLHDVTDMFPARVRNTLNRLNWLARFFTPCAFAAIFASLAFWPWFCLLLPAAPAIASLRSFAIARGLRAAIGES